MDLKQYTRDAIRTESKIETVTTNYKTLRTTLSAVIAAGTLLDMIKKNVFYRKPVDQAKFDLCVDKLLSAAWAFDAGEAPLPNVESQEINVDPRVFHAIVGAITEGAELAEALEKIIAGNEDKVNILEEFGDINWYEAIAVDALDGDFEQILERNIAKLRARFPEKFTSEQAINRDLETERKVLEGK